MFCNTEQINLRITQCVQTCSDVISTELMTRQEFLAEDE